MSHITVPPVPHPPESPLVHQLREEALGSVSSCAAVPGTGTKFPPRLPRGEGAGLAQGPGH